MAASQKTIAECRAVFLLHMKRDAALKLIRDLRKVEGNAAFVELMGLLEQTLREAKR